MWIFPMDIDSCRITAFYIRFVLRVEWTSNDCARESLDGVAEKNGHVDRTSASRMFAFIHNQDNMFRVSNMATKPF